MADSREIKTMRAMEWERVKGGINAIFSSYWDFDDYGKLDVIVDEFLERFGETSGIDQMDYV